ncbi:hypothetical protein OIO90_003243 [Microbotryomycetes sp. JL221]|nr:hypothetical protein OIO90_003243 [Microbotryomycetes sp. JL221]
MSRLAPPIDGRFFFHDDHVVDDNDKGVQLSNRARDASQPSLSSSRRLKRTLSGVSLPSPPQDMHLDDQHELVQSKTTVDVDLATNEDEVDELDSSDDNDNGDTRQALTRPTQSTKICSNMSTSRVNSTLRLQHASTRPDQRGHLRVDARLDRTTRHDEDQDMHRTNMSPTDRAKKLRRDRQRRTKTDDERPATSVWDSPNNPFIDRPTHKSNATRDNEPWTPGQASKPDKLTYVFRGKRVTYDIPFDTLVSSEDPEDDVFPETKPRLLFPPVQQTPTTPPSTKLSTASFIATLKNNAIDTTNEMMMSIPVSPKKPINNNGLPPTPVTGRRRGYKTTGAGSSSTTRFGPYKKMNFEGHSPDKRTLLRR